MPFIEWLMHRAPMYNRLSKNEVKILATMTTIKSGNAYNAWKASGLKHYPTVLRTLRKLEEKGLVEVLSENGIRGERIYAQTLFGKLLHYALRDERAKLTEIISQNSTRFQGLLESKTIDDTWAYRIVVYMAVDVISNRSRKIDDILKEAFSEIVTGEVMNIVYDKKHWNEIIRLTKDEWIKELTIERIEIELEWSKRFIQKLRQLKETLMEK